VDFADGHGGSGAIKVSVRALSLDQRIVCFCRQPVLTCKGGDSVQAGKVAFRVWLFMSKAPVSDAGSFDRKRRARQWRAAQMVVCACRKARPSSISPEAPPARCSGSVSQCLLTRIAAVQPSRPKGPVLMEDRLTV